MSTDTCPRCGNGKSFLATVCRQCYKEAIASGFRTTKQIKVWANAKLKVKATGSCMIYVEGMNFPCPLCHVVVKSGERHQCSK